VCLGVIGFLTHASAAELREVTWDDLIPPEALKKLEAWSAGGMKDDALLEDPEITDGVVADLNGAQIRLPGFIVPLEGDEVGTVTEFFLVPYFGACIHTPPPPPNQIVYVTVDRPYRLEAMWEPVWIEGAMRAEQTSTDLGLAGYAMKAIKIEEYKE
jgi:uncharacterized protein